MARRRPGEKQVPRARRKGKAQHPADERVTAGPGRPLRAERPTLERDSRTAFFDQAGPHAPYLGVEAHGARFVVATSDRKMGKHLFSKQARPEFKVLERAVTVVEILTGDDAIAGRAFVDVGANIGTSTVSALVSQGFGSAVSCEPEEEQHRLLRVNLALNDLEEQVRALRVGVSDRVGRSNLFVIPAGKSQIALDPTMIHDRQAKYAARRLDDPTVAVPDLSVSEVELVTLDHLAETGVIDPGLVGMLWIDAEGHEGHVMAGAGVLADEGVPIVFEFHPAGLKRHGGQDMVHQVAEQCYTHFVDVRRQEAGEPRFRLRSVMELSSLADRFLDPSLGATYTDLLLLRLDPEQASAGENLPELFVKRRSVADRGIG